MRVPKWLKPLTVAAGINGETIPRNVVMPFRQKTGRQGDLPSILIVGAQKSGTTTLHNLLLLHPRIRGGLIKESHFFDKPELLAKGEGFYRSIFPRLAPGEHTIDSTPMMYHEAIPEIAARIVPDAKIIMLLRDPVKRAFSHYLHNVARKRETLSFEEALAAEEERIRHSAADLETESEITYRYRAFTYKERSRYDVQIERWRAAYGEDRVKVMIFEEFAKSLEPGVNEVLAWLDLDPVALPASAMRPRNEAVLKARMAPETEAALRRELAPSVARLRDLLGRDLPWEYPGVPAAREAVVEQVG